MKIDWANWDLGAKIVLIAAGLALCSFFLPWSFSPRSAAYTLTGFRHGWPLIGLVFFIVPLLQLVRGGSVKKMVGYTCAGLALAVGVGFVVSANVQFSVRSINVSSWGSYVYIMTAVALGVGVHMNE